MELWCWSYGVGVVVWELWCCSCGVGVVVLELWCGSCGLGLWFGVVVLGLWCWSCGVGVVVWESCGWSLVAGALWLETLALEARAWRPGAGDLKIFKNVDLA